MAKNFETAASRLQTLEQAYKQKKPCRNFAGDPFSTVALSPICFFLVGNPWNVLDFFLQSWCLILSTMVKTPLDHLFNEYISYIYIYVYISQYLTFANSLKQAHLRKMTQHQLDESIWQKYPRTCPVAACNDHDKFRPFGVTLWHLKNRSHFLILLFTGEVDYPMIFQGCLLNPFRWRWLQPTHQQH